MLCIYVAEPSPSSYALYFPQPTQSRTPSPLYPVYQNTIYTHTPNITYQSPTHYSPSSPQQPQGSPANHMSPHHQGLNIVSSSCIDVGLPRQLPGLHVPAAEYDVSNIQNVAALVNPSNAGIMTNGEPSYLDMDMCNSVNRLDSNDLDLVLHSLGAGNLSENLSANLTLS